MDKIIVTVTDRNRSFFYDVELPLAMTGARLREDLYEALTTYRTDLYLVPPGASAVLCNRLGRCIGDEETLADAGVWNGDYFTITEANHG